MFKNFGGILPIIAVFIVAFGIGRANASIDLVRAAFKGEEAIVRALLKNGANVNFATTSGNTALIQASGRGHIKIVEILLKFGAKPTIENSAGKRAIDVAKSRGFSEITMMLLAGSILGNEISTKKINRSVTAKKAPEPSSDVQKELAKLRRENARKERLTEEVRLAAETEKKRKAELARKKVEAEEEEEEEEEEGQRLAEIARRKAEAKRIAAAKQKAERDKAMYTPLASSAEVLSTNARQFITVNPGTPGMLDIVMHITNTEAALKTKNSSAVKTALASFRATLSKEKGFSAFMTAKKKARQERLAEEKRLAAAKRKRQLAEARRRADEKRRRLAAQVSSVKDDLKSYVAFLKVQITQAVIIDPNLVRALVPLVRSLEGGLSSNELSVLQGLKKQADAALRKHGLRKQYAEIQKMMAAARAAGRNKEEAKKRREKQATIAVKHAKEREASQKRSRALAALARKKEEARRAVEEKKAAVLAARQEKYRDAVAVVIGNRKYANRVPEVEFAHNDANAMRRYLLGLGYREGNIIFIKDATQSQLIAVFGSKDTHRGKLFSYVRAGESDVTVFYSGHGVPGLKDRRGYLLPVDADPNLVELNGYPIDLLYSNLNKLRAKTMRVYMDACFSGDSPNGMLVRAASGISVKPRMPKKRAGSNMISITAAQGDQFASWDEDAKHGLFTKHLLEALEGKADAKRYGNRDGKVTVAEVKNYLDREMTYQARRRYNRDQTAAVFGDRNLVLSSYR